MQLIDARGRLFGGINAVDAAVAAVAVASLLAPIAAYRVVASKPPVFTNVGPVTISAGDPVRLRITGRDIRPFLQALVAPHGRAPTEDPTRGEWIGIGDTTVGELQLPPLPPGEYDLHIYDKGQEIAARPSAFTVRP